MRKMFSKKQIEKMIESVSVETINDLINTYSEGEIANLEDVVFFAKNSSQKHYLGDSEELTDVMNDMIIGDFYKEYGNDYMDLCLYKDPFNCAVFVIADDYAYIDRYLKEDNTWNLLTSIQLNPSAIDFLFDLLSNAESNPNNVMIKPTATAEYDSDNSQIKVKFTKGFMPVFLVFAYKVGNTWYSVDVTRVISAGSLSFTITGDETCNGYTFDENDSEIYITDLTGGSAPTEFEIRQLIADSCSGQFEV